MSLRLLPVLMKWYAQLPSESISLLFLTFLVSTIVPARIWIPLKLTQAAEKQLNEIALGFCRKWLHKGKRKEGFSTREKKCDGVCCPHLNVYVLMQILLRIVKCVCWLFLISPSALFSTGQQFQINNSIRLLQTEWKHVVALLKLSWRPVPNLTAGKNVGWMSCSYWIFKIIILLWSFVALINWCLSTIHFSLRSIFTRTVAIEISH